MIPPVPPGQSANTENMVRWVNTFDMRQTTLSNLAASNLTFRTNPRSQGLFTRMRGGCESNATKSLDILRRNLQSAITKDIDGVIKKYMEKFFQPAFENIRNNLGKDSVNEDHLKEVCRHILDDVKQLYQTTPQSRDSCSPYECSDSDASNMGLQRSLEVRKRKESDTDSENSQSALQKRIRQNQTMEGPKWNPDRITSTTLFIMGARANKVLGYGQTRGRLYVRHPDLMRYSGDPEDKDWLSRHNLLPANGGKAYLMILDDIKELSLTEEYRSNPNLLLNELQGFEIPHFMLNKIRGFMEQVRDRDEFGQNSTSPTTDVSLSSLIDMRNSDLGIYNVAPECSPPETSHSFMTHNQMGINNLLNSGPPTLSYMPNLKRTKKLLDHTGFNLTPDSQDF